MVSGRGFGDGSPLIMKPSLSNIWGVWDVHEKMKMVIGFGEEMIVGLTCLRVSSCATA